MNSVDSFGKSVNRRSFPKELVRKGEKEPRGYYDYRSSGPLLAVVYNMMKGTLHSAVKSGETPVTVARREL